MHPGDARDLPLSIFLPDELQFEPTVLGWSPVATNDRPMEGSSATRGAEVLLTRGSRGGTIERSSLQLPAEATALDTVHLVLEFEIAGWSPDGTDCLLPIPVLEVEIRDPDSRDLFAAEIVIPAGRSLVEGFPTGVHREAGGTASTFAVYRLDSFPVIPRFLRFELRSGSPPLWTIARLADSITVTVLLVMLGLAWRRFRSLAE